MAEYLHNPLLPKEIQELLCLWDFPVAIDGDIGPATDFAMKALKRELIRYNNPTADADAETAAFLTSPFRFADSIPATVQREGDTKLSEAVRSIARMYLRMRCREVGGDNRGPWVRYFSRGAEGDAIKWCANFAAVTVLDQAEKAVAGVRASLGLPALVRPGRYRSGSCTTIQKRAKEDGTLITSEDVLSGKSKVTPGMLFLIRKDPISTHIGVVMSVDDSSPSFESIEGNAGYQEGGRGDLEVVSRRFRNYRKAPHYFIDIDRGQT